MVEAGVAIVALLGLDDEWIDQRYVDPITQAGESADNS